MQQRGALQAPSVSLAVEGKELGGPAAPVCTEQSLGSLAASPDQPIEPAGSTLPARRPPAATHRSSRAAAHPGTPRLFFALQALPAAMADKLFAVRNTFYLGGYQSCISECRRAGGEHLPPLKSSASHAALLLLLCSYTGMPPCSRYRVATPACRPAAAPAPRASPPGLPGPLACTSTD